MRHFRHYSKRLNKKEFSFKRLWVRLAFERIIIKFHGYSHYKLYSE